MSELKFDKEATLKRLLSPVPKPTKPTPLGEVLQSIEDERRIMREALEHISRTSNNYESSYAKKILESLK